MNARRVALPIPRLASSERRRRWAGAVLPIWRVRVKWFFSTTMVRWQRCKATRFGWIRFIVLRDGIFRWEHWAIVGDVRERACNLTV